MRSQCQWRRWDILIDRGVASGVKPFDTIRCCTTSLTRGRCIPTDRVEGTRQARSPDVQGRSISKFKWGALLSLS